MKEIKFRAWDKLSKVMFYNIQNAYDTLSYANVTDREGNSVEYDADCFGTVLEEKLFDSQFNETEEHRYIVEQFTGLKDKNGKEIYEGDKIKYNFDKKNSITFSIKFYSAGFGYMYFGDFHFMTAYKSSNCEIIGNIHDAS